MTLLQLGIGTVNDVVDAPRRRRPEARQADPGRARAAPAGAGRPRRGGVRCRGRPAAAVASRPAVLAVVVIGDRPGLRPPAQGHGLVVAAVRGRDPDPARSSAGSARRGRCRRSFASCVPAVGRRRRCPGDRQRARRRRARPCGRPVDRSAVALGPQRASTPGSRAPARRPRWSPSLTAVHAGAGAPVIALIAVARAVVPSAAVAGPGPRAATGPGAPLAGRGAIAWPASRRSGWPRSSRSGALDQ